MMNQIDPKPIIGQEAICPHGLGRVSAFKDSFPTQWIKVDTYIDNRGCKWAPHNVELIDPRGSFDTKLLELAVEAFHALDNAYEQNGRDYHNCEYWEDKQYQRLSDARDMLKPIHEALKK